MLVFEIVILPCQKTVSFVSRVAIASQSVTGTQCYQGTRDERAATVELEVILETDSAITPGDGKASKPKEAIRPSQRHRLEVIPSQKFVGANGDLMLRMLILNLCCRVISSQTGR